MNLLPHNRRQMLQRSALSFGSLALAGLLEQEGLLTKAHAAIALPRLSTSIQSVVFIFLGGGPGQNDTFDPKPELTRLAGRRVPDSIAKDVPQIARAPLDNLLASPWKFQRYGQSGIEVSELFPQVARHVDDLCVIRSMRHDSPIHAPAEYLSMTGALTGDRPSLGAWLSYGLGSENRDLPAFVVFRTGETLRPPAVASGFLPATYQGVQLDSRTGVPNLKLPADISSADRAAQLEFLSALNRRHAAGLAESELEARIASYELGFRMQSAAAEAFDLAGETQETLRLYGLGEPPASGVEQKEADEYARIFLLTRRLVERGVRFIQIRSGGWDAHSDLLGNHSKKCGATDRPIAALLTDLKRRGLWNNTLVVWGGEFGRTPTCQPGAGKPGRDHSPSGYSMWLAGGPVRGGQVIGRTDDVGYAAIERPVHPHDLHATLLHALGIDQHELYCERNGRQELVTVNGGQVIEEVFN